MCFPTTEYRIGTKSHGLVEGNVLVLFWWFEGVREGMVRLSEVLAGMERNNGANPKGNGCFECGAVGHFKRDCPKLKNKDGESNNGREPRLIVISCLKAQEYMAKGCEIFLAQISAKKEEDKSKGKHLEDVPVVRDYPEVFPKDLPGLPPARLV
nr:putative reverse transcriptase domain-containing protein [Tanacetum cinerariifolium]